MNRHRGIIRIIMIATLLSLTKIAVAQPSQDSDGLVVRGDPDLTFQIRRDRIAVALKEPKNPDLIPQQLKVDDVPLVLADGETWRNLVIYRLPQRVTHQRQYELSQLLLPLAAQWAEEAGPLMTVKTPVRSKTPLMLRSTLIVDFHPGINQEAIDDFNEQQGAKKSYVHKHRPHRYTVIFDKSIIGVFKNYRESKLVRWTTPDRIDGLTASFYSTSTGCLQWHHANSSDADIDTNRAWSFSSGSKTTIAMVDRAEAVHKDLEDNLWNNPLEFGGMKGKDDDGNKKVDDEHGWGWAVGGGPDSGSPDFMANSHGTSAAGCVVAKGKINANIKGVSPDAKFMVLGAAGYLQIGHAVFYAADEGADVICIPQSPITDDYLKDAINYAVCKGRGGKGCVVCVSILNPYDGTNLSDRESLIAVRHTNDSDQLATPKAIGQSLNLVAPGWRIATTTLSASNNPMDPCPKGYVGAFSGPSAAAPITAGVAGLVLDVAPCLKWNQVLRLLQDTCDKVQPSLAAYAPEDGYSNPISDNEHGYGRLNAYEAVRIVAPTSKSGKGGIDVMVRDNCLDWGNTEKPSDWVFGAGGGTLDPSSSQDIKVDVEPYHLTTPISTSAAFECHPDQTPEAGRRARVYVRVRNRGPLAAEDVDVELFFSDQAMLPPLPTGGATSWQQIDTTHQITTLPYSGCSAARTLSTDPAAVLTFEWSIPSGVDDDNLTLLVMLSSSQDPISTTLSDALRGAAEDNNITLKTYTGSTITVPVVRPVRPSVRPSRPWLRLRCFRALRARYGRSEG